ncbi:unnamed protein product [marine sediment metagenome]|uniref:Uncharacterized protein n=1 Tax=marine sediment metagenome TaxID=412755 RepID=X1BW62_9ZZZZ
MHLKRDSVPDALARIGRGHRPVDAEHIAREVGELGEGVVCSLGENDNGDIDTKWF